ncbi:DUF2306 domain-containing protein [Acinetobacter sp. Marseille-Q1618]|uniref:DUF2306 domain-containing protein n=1 Tax=Acinetobacter sp. Marseille-Q1618 TaxID=2697502 RepID=UPI00156F6AC1|nr:DUF2306 domain-containing protein [Acinetobacter sp. Marseille-Q1618]
MHTIKNKNTNKILLILILGIYFYLCVLMLKICLAYFPWQDDNNFLALKQDVVTTQPWRFAFQVHVLVSSLLLIAGFTQFFSQIRQKFPKIHRYSGWLYIISVFIFALPSGFIMAFSAAGGWQTKLCFILLSILWGVSTFIALYKIIKKDWLAHHDWMIRSFALALSALSLRTWKIILYNLQPYFDWLTPVHIYQLEAWLGWVINLIIAEVIILKLHQNKKP